MSGDSVDSDVTKLMANFFFRFSRPPYVVRMFTAEADALRWLEEQRASAVEAP